MKIKNRHVYETLIFDVFGVLFDYNKTFKSLLKMGALSLHISLGSSKNIFSPFHETIALLKQCYQHYNAEGKRSYNLYVLSNMTTKTTEVLTKKFPEVFSLFDGIVTSGSCGFKKPDPRIFNHLLLSYNLNPHTCLFFDDKQKNIKAAEALGITGIICNEIKRIKDQLAMLDIL